jgi:RNA polymerase sigma-70 factor (ECF subfamily)
MSVGSTGGDAPGRFGGLLRFMRMESPEFREYRLAVRDHRSQCHMDSRARKITDLVERHYALLYRYAYRLTGSEADAEDLTQQAFLTAQTKWDQLRDENCARSWLFTIVRNAYLKERRTPVSFTSMALEMMIESTGTAEEADFDGEQLQNALNDLPEEFRSPLILFYFQDFSYKEIADHMEVPIGTVMSRLARAKAFLRRQLTAPELAATISSDSDQRVP